MSAPMPEPSIRPELMRELLLLEQQLGDLSELKFREVVRLLETVQHKPAVHSLLERMRERLKRVRPPRRISLQRLAYYPVEDLLILDPVGRNDCRISRRLMAMVWDYVVRHGDPVRLAELNEQLLALAPDDREGLDNLALLVWPFVSDCLGKATREALTDRQVRRALVGLESVLLPEVQRVTMLLSLGRAIEMMKAVLPPKPMRVLEGEPLTRVQRLIQDAHQGRIDLAYGMLLVLSVRFTVPAAILDVLHAMRLGFQADERQELFNRVCQMVLGEMENAAREIKESACGDLSDRVAALRALTDQLVIAERNLRSDLEGRRRLVPMREIARSALADLVSQAEIQIGRLFVQGAETPVNVQAEAENALLILRRCESFAAGLSLSPTVDYALKTVARSVDFRLVQLFDALSDPQTHRPDLEKAEREIYWSVRLLELVGRGEDADSDRKEGLLLLSKAKNLMLSNVNS